MFLADVEIKSREIVENTKSPRGGGRGEY